MLEFVGFSGMRFGLYYMCNIFFFHGGRYEY